MIDFDRDDLDLVYLVEINYHHEGEPYKAHWCGPTDRCGDGGLVAPDPATGTPTQWESRLDGGRIDRDLGGLLEGLARVASASFTVAAGGPDSADLRVRIRDGYWINRLCRIWLLDRSTGSTQHAGDGEVTRQPSAWGDGSFGMAVRFWPFPDSLEWPTDEIPRSVPTTWDPADNASVSAGNKWHPSNGAAESYQLNPEHKGKHLGRIFGGSNGYGDGTFVELVPYGMQTQTEDYIFCWVSSVELCFVRDVWWESDDGIINRSTIGGGDMRPFVNRDPTRGPLGTCIKVDLSLASSTQKPRWWASDVTHTLQGEGASHRVYGMVVGPGYADFPAGFDEELDPFLLASGFFNADATIPGSSTPWRGRYDKILEDLDSAPWLNAFAPFLGTNTIADFIAAAPSYFIDGFDCRIPMQIAEKPPAMREVMAEFMSALQADLCWRLDPVTEVMALFPIWRGPRPTAVADWTWVDADLVRVEQPRAIRWDDDPFRDYATRVRVRAPDRMGQPGVERVDLRKESAAYVSTPEEAAGKYGGKLLKDIPRKHWVNTGNVSARNAGEHHCQRQRQSEATHGRRGFKVQLGDLGAYKIGDYPTSIGQVRKTAWDLDAVKATITALHIEAFPDDGDAKEGED